MRLAFASLVGAPGATTLWHAAGIRWSAPRVLLIEADPDGGRIAARTGLSLDRDAPTLITLAGAIRHRVDDEVVWRHTQTLGDLAVVVAPSSPRVAERAVTHLANKWSEVDAALGNSTDVLVDVGRLRPGGAGIRIAASCDQCLVVVRPVLDEITVLLDSLDDLADTATIKVVVRGHDGYPMADIAKAISDRRPDVELIATLADDRRGVAVLNGDATMTAKRFERSPLVRSVDEILTAVGQFAEAGALA